MGYTHYWYQKRPFTPEEWAKIKAEAERICAAAQEKDITLVDSDDHLAGPHISDDQIAFNGIPAHEDFVLERESSSREIDGERFTFCKTAQKPYDAAVVSILHVASTVAPDAIRVTSDGGKQAIALEL